MIRIKVDDWSQVHSGSGFFIMVDTIPRKGDSVKVHRSICGDDFLICHKEDFDDEMYAIGGFASFIVANVEHRMGPEGVEIEVDVQSEW